MAKKTAGQLLFFLCLCSLVFSSQCVEAKSNFSQKIALQKLNTCLTEQPLCKELEDSIIRVASAQLPDSSFASFLFDASNLYLQQYQFKSTKALLTKAKGIALRLENTVQVIKIKRRFSLAYFYEGHLDSAQFVAQEVLEYYQEKKDSLNLGISELYIGQILKEKGVYSEAMAKYVKSLTIFKNLKDQINQANVYAEISTLYAMSNDNEKAIEFGRKAAKIFKGLPNHESKFAYVSLNLANNLSFAHQPDSAIKILNYVIPFYEAENNQYMLMNALAQLSRAQYEKGNISEALETMKKSNAIDPGARFPGQSIYNFQLMGRMYNEQGNIDEAIVFFKKSYKLHQVIGINDELKTLLEDLATAYTNAGQSDSALKYYIAFIDVTDSLNSVEKETRLNEIKEQYETELREEQLRNNANEILLLEKSNTAKTQRNITLIIILMVVLALTISIISRQRNSIRLNKMLATQSKKTHQAELQAQAAEKQQLEEDLNHRKRELANQALLIAEKNELLRSFRNEVEKVGEAEEKANKSLKRISRKMERAENQQGDWDKFMMLFKDVHPKMLNELSHINADLTHNDLRLLALMKMNFTNKEIADILHITEGGLKKARYRLRKKLQLVAHASIHQYIQNI